MLDTGMRVSELCGLTYQDISLQERKCSVLGKGNKRRTIPFGRRASQALNSYLAQEERQEDTSLFLSDRGMTAGEGITSSGVLIMIRKLGRAAGVEVVRCSPHTFRHTFAVMFLRNGGNVFTLQQLLGHNRLDMTNRYVTLAQADIENQHRQFSPADRMKRR
jgi:site-specific recombinase XerD